MEAEVFCRAVLAELALNNAPKLDPYSVETRRGFAAVIHVLEAEAVLHSGHVSWHRKVVRLTNALRQNNNGVYEEFLRCWVLRPTSYALEKKEDDLVRAAAKAFFEESTNPDSADPTPYPEQRPEDGGDVCVRLPDGSGFMTASLPLPASHWLYRKRGNVPPMGLRTGTHQTVAVLTTDSGGTRVLKRSEAEALIKRAARFAARASTMNGTMEDWDPDALVQNMVIGLLGYQTPDGLSPEAWANPGPEGDAARLELAREYKDPTVLADCLEYKCECPEVELEVS